MINIFRTLIVLLAVSMIQSCDNSERKTESGLNYTVVREGNGTPIEDGYYLMLNMEYKDNKDSVWMSTAKNGMPVVMPKNDSIWNSRQGSVEQIFRELTKGDSITFDISIKDFYANSVNSDVPESVDKDGTMTFNIGVEDVMDREGLMAWQQKMMAKQQQKRQEMMEEQMRKEEELAKVQLPQDVAAIEQYLKDNNINAEKTESGLYYVIQKKGKGANAGAGDTVKVNYAGHVLNGAYFDTSIEEVAKKNGLFDERRTYEPFQFVLGQGQVIKGWDEGIALLNKGGKATLYIPSTMAYGSRQVSEEIVPNSILVFDVELIDIVK